MNMFWNKWTKRFEEEKRVLKNGRSLNGKQDWSKLPQDKIDFINDVHAKEADYWKRIALEGRSEDEKKQLEDLTPLKVFFGS